MGDMLETHARLNPACLGARDLERSLTFFQWNDRARRLANALLGMGLEKGDRVAILAYNRLEWAELYAATAKAGLIAVPLNFRLSPIEMKFILDDCGASAVIAQDDDQFFSHYTGNDTPINPGHGQEKICHHHHY